LFEIKAFSCLTSADEAQLLNQLKATNKELGLLINFGNQKELDWKRKVNSGQLNANSRQSPPISANK
jgi:GxxExxY protein